MKELSPERIIAARRRWQLNLPVTLPEMAAAMELTYREARALAGQQGFPRFGRFIFRDAVEQWRALSVQAAVPPRRQPTRPDRPAKIAGKPDEPLPTHGLPGAWPPRAARLRALTSK